MDTGGSEINKISNNKELIRFHNIALNYNETNNLCDLYIQIVETIVGASSSLSQVVSFFFFFFLRPFQDYFAYFKSIVNQRWAKTGELEYPEKTT